MFRSSVSNALLALLLANAAAAQMVLVDRTHPVNTFSPVRALGAGVDRMRPGAAEQLLRDPYLKQTLAAGWQSVSYRQNTELFSEAWHWNPQGSWSDPAGRGYFTGSTAPGEPILRSYAYPLPHRGSTRGAPTDYSRLTDGDPATYWKSNPYLTRTYTDEDDALHPQWVLIDLGSKVEINAVRIRWAEPYARRYSVQFWTTDDDPLRQPAKGTWQTFPLGAIADGHGGTVTLTVSSWPVPVRWLRVRMTESSNTCDTHGASDGRNCVGYAISELYAGTLDPDGEFHDLVLHAANREQSPAVCSSVDPWHEAANLDVKRGEQVGFDLFYTSGITRGLPAMIPVAVLYSTPEDAAAEIAYLQKRGYPISYVELGEEPDGQAIQPEDYGALYLQFAAAIHKVDPKLKLGGPSFEGSNKDIEVWADAQGRVSWLGRFLDYMKAHGRMDDFNFFSFEHYPFDPCNTSWNDLYEGPKLIEHVLQVWKDDGLPEGLPIFATEANLGWQLGHTFVDIMGALWLADYTGAFLAAGGNASYYFHYLPAPLHPGCGNSWGSFGFFNVDANLNITGRHSQFFASQLLTQEWVQPVDEAHRLYRAQSDVRDAFDNVLVTAYAVERPDGQWALLLINKDKENAHAVRIAFGSEGSERFFAGPVEQVTFGANEYQWHPNAGKGYAAPGGPAAKATVTGGEGASYALPAASITVLRGRLNGA